MMHTNHRLMLLAGFLVACLGIAGCAHDQLLLIFMPEQRNLDLRNPEALPKAGIPDLPPPPTVLNYAEKLPERYLSLDEAIRITLANSQVVRVLTGFSATSSGRTIYDTAITNTLIDQERGRFDPFLEFNNSVDVNEQPFAVIDPFSPNGARLDGLRSEVYNMLFGLSKTTVHGGKVSMNVNSAISHFRPGDVLLNPQARHTGSLRWDQPLLQGAGARANLAPIVIARINTERSFFQFKDAMQESVRGVIDAYWALVFARTDVWVRQEQVKLFQFAYDRAEAQRKVGRANIAEVAQARSALENFRATLVTAKANVILREGALRNILGLPPSDGRKFVPITPPTKQQARFDWNQLVTLAEERRPDLIELKLIIEADQQMLAQANNRALPRMDAMGLYRWNGLEGRTPTRTHIGTEGNEFTGWLLGVNFSLPLTLRRDRAALRQQKLILARDWANLDQGLHFAVSDLTISVRNLAQFYEQYKSFKEARAASRQNLDFQYKDYIVGRAIFLNVLQAVNDWGNAVSAEAQALAQYNTELATLERKTGTILETHGILFFEERGGFIGPLGRIARPKCYPSSVNPGPNGPRYPNMTQPSENFFDLRAPVSPDSGKRRPPERLPQPKIEEKKK